MKKSELRQIIREEVELAMEAGLKSKIRKLNPFMKPYLQHKANVSGQEGWNWGFIGDKEKAAKFDKTSRRYDRLAHHKPPFRKDISTSREPGNFWKASGKDPSRKFGSKNKSGEIRYFPDENLARKWAIGSN